MDPRPVAWAIFTIIPRLFSIPIFIPMINNLLLIWPIPLDIPLVIPLVTILFSYFIIILNKLGRVRIMKGIGHYVHMILLPEIITVIKFSHISAPFLNVPQEVLILLKLFVLIQTVQNPIIVLLNRLISNSTLFKTFHVKSLASIILTAEEALLKSLGPVKIYSCGFKLPL